MIISERENEMHTHRSVLALLLLGVSITAAAQQPAGEQPTAQAPANPAAGGPPAGGRGAAGLTDSRLNVDIFALMERLAVEMDKEFILDPRMRGLAGLSTGGSDADYDSLLAILRTNGYAAIEGDDQIRIVPDAIARSEPSPLVQEDDSRISDHAVVTRIIDTSGIRASEVRGEGEVPVSVAATLAPVLRPLMSTAIGHVSNPPGTDKLIITDRYDIVRRITAIVDELRQ
jgi:general secretion pathway protein D